MEDLSNAYMMDAYRCSQAAYQVEDAIINIITQANNLHEYGQYNSSISIYQRALEIGYDYEKNVCYLPSREDAYDILNKWGH